MKKKSIAILTSAMMLTSATALPPVQAADTTTSAKLPDWVPTDYASALEFRNNFGATHVEDGLICLVFKEKSEKIPEGEPRGVLRYEIKTSAGNTKLLKKSIYSSENGEYDYDVFVYQPTAKGDFEVSFEDTFVTYGVLQLDPAYGKQTYTFSIDDSLVPTETDIYSWLPDSFMEFRDISSCETYVRDNYLAMCMETGTGSGFNWYSTPGNTYDESVIDYVLTSDCSEETTDPGGIKAEIQLYQAKKDGSAKISYDYVADNGRPYLPSEVSKRMIADCMVIDGGKSILLKGNMRFTFIDSETGEPVAVSDSTSTYVHTDIRYNTDAGEMMTGPMHEFFTNPTVIRDLSNFFDADHFSFWLEQNELPEGYSFIDGSRTQEYSNGTITPKAGMIVTRYDNGSADVVIKLKRKTAPDLQKGQMRVSLVDYDTGEPITISEDNRVSMSTSIEVSTPNGSAYTGPVYRITENPSIVDDSLANFFSAKSFSFGLSNLPSGYTVYGGTLDDSGYMNGKIVPDDYMSVTRYDNGSADVTFRLKKDGSASKGTTTITFYDKDTGELVDIPDKGAGNYLQKNISGGGAYTSELYTFSTNPFTVDSLDVYGNYSYSLNMGNESGWYTAPKLEVVSKDANHIELAVRVKWSPSGDINEDKAFGVSDVMLLQKFLHGTYKSEFNHEAVDYFHDGKLDVFDLILMKRALIKNNGVYVDPDNRVLYGAEIEVLKDGLKLYQGPDESYPVVGTLPKGAMISERGYMSDNDKWMCTFYDGQYGWLRVFDEKGSWISDLVRYDAQIKKPVIYLYPEKETDVSVKLELTEAELSTTYPKYNNGWEVTASPDGSVLNKADGTHHKYLFWDAVNCRTRYDFSKGFCVAGSDTESFLKEKLTYMGLNENEMNEFIVYWLPRMEHNAYNLISFQGEAYTDSAKLDITPKPDSLLRVFMTYVPLDNAVDIEPQQLDTFERKGFAVVEWGGTELSR